MNSAHYSSGEDGKPSEEESRTFALFTASIGHLVPSITETGIQVIQTAQGLRDDHALRRLQKLCELHEQYDTFIIRGPYNFAASMDEDEVWYQKLTLSATLATAIMESLEKTKSQWKQLHIWHAQVNGPLLQVLDTAKRQGIFHSLQLRNLNDSVLATYPLLSSFALKNPKLTRLKLHGVAIDLPCLELLKVIVATTSFSPNDEGSMLDNFEAHQTHLTSLEIQNEDRRLTEGELHVLSSGLRYNHTLKHLSLQHADFDSSFVDSLMGNPTLELLNLSRGRFSEGAILGLGKVLQHPGCRIKSLVLDECEIFTSSRFIGPLRIDILAIAMGNGSCSSLVSLSLQRNTASSRDLQKLMKAVHACCPNLQEIDLTQNRIERIIWNHNDVFPVATHGTSEEPLQSLGQGGDNNSSGDSSTTLSFSTTSNTNSALQCLFLNRNPIIHNRFRARSIVDNSNFEDILVDFPALGQIAKGEKVNTRFLPFSSKVHMLLLFNRVTRGRLRSQGQFPIALWYNVLARIPLLLEREGQEMSSHKTTNATTTFDHQIRHARTCQASVLFLLLHRHPSQVTRDACRTMQDETSNSLGLPLLSIAKNEATSPIVRPKRRKLK